MNPQLQARIKTARKNFAAMAAAYFLGLFNDNFYKEAALIMAVSAGRTGIQALAAAVFTLSYMFATAPGGWWADRFAKGHVIIASKALEVLAMVAGAFGLWHGNWLLVLAMLGLTAAQSAIFSPAMNGSIPELYPAEYVQTANTIVRVLATAAIFIGMALAGRFMDMTAMLGCGIVRGPFWVGTTALAAAVAGLALSWWAPRIPARGARPPFPWRGPWESVVELRSIGADRLLALCVCGNVFLWSLAAVMTLLMVNMGLGQFGFSASATAAMKIIFLAGVSVGGVLSNFAAKGRRFFNVFIPCYFIMAAFLLLTGLVPLFFRGSAAAWSAAVLISLAGVAGGMLLIPMESFIQLRPASDRKGRVLAAVNFAVFGGMTVGAGALYILNKLFEPTTSLAVLGAVTTVYTFRLRRRMNELAPEIAAL